MTFEEAMGLTKRFNKTAKEFFKTNDDSSTIFLGDLQHHDNVSEEFFPRYAQEIERGELVIGPSIYLQGSKYPLFPICEGSVGLWKKREEKSHDG